MEELIESVYDHEQRLSTLERLQAQNRIDGPIRWTLAELPGGQYTISLFNEDTNGSIVIATI